MIFTKTNSLIVDLKHICWEINSIQWYHHQHCWILRSRYYPHGLSASSNLSGYLDVSDRNLTEFSFKNSINKNKIHTIDASNNNLKTIEDPNIFDEFINLQALDLSNNKHFNVLNERKLLIQMNLQNFACENCNIDEIFTETFQSLPELISLNLINNQIKTIQFNSFHLNLNLELLLLDGNKLTTFNGNLLRNSLNFQTLSLNNNYQLNFNNNHELTSHTLIELNCDSCNLTEITPLTFSRLPQLKRLSLNNNKIQKISSIAFDRNLFLFYLNLENNFINSFSLNMFKKLITLNTLCLSGNQVADDNDVVKQLIRQRNILNEELITNCNNEGEYLFNLDNEDGDKLNDYEVEYKVDNEEVDEEVDYVIVTTTKQTPKQKNKITKKSLPLKIKSIVFLKDEKTDIPEITTTTEESIKISNNSQNIPFSVIKNQSDCFQLTKRGILERIDCSNDSNSDENLFNYIYIIFIIFILILIVQIFVFFCCWYLCKQHDKRKIVNDIERICNMENTVNNYKKKYNDKQFIPFEIQIK